MDHIPLRNVWLLQLFASDLYQRQPGAFVDVEKAPAELPELVAGILADEVTRRLHNGLGVMFRRTTRPLRRVRGRIDVLTTERHQLMDRGMVQCTFDEIVTDTPANRLVRAALECAAQHVPDDPRYRALSLQLLQIGVTGPRPSLGDVPVMLRTRALVRDRLMISAAELMLGWAVPTTDTGSRFLPRGKTDDEYLRKLFEHAVFGYYKHLLLPQGWKVRHGQQQHWPLEATSTRAQDVLPRMELDITLTEPAESRVPRHIVIDTKFTSVTAAGQYGRQTLKSGYLYQMYAYLRSQEHDRARQASEGLFIHPVTSEHFDEEVTIQGHRIRFATVNLGADGATIIDDLLGAISTPL